MTALTIVPANVRPLLGAVTRPYTAGEAMGVGKPVYMKSDGLVWLTDADAAASAKVLGVVVAVSGYGALVAAAGDQVDVTLAGPITGYSGMTPGADAFVSATAGELQDAAPAGASGDYLYNIGYALSATNFLVRPTTTDTAAQ